LSIIGLDGGPHEVDDAFEAIKLDAPEEAVAAFTNDGGGLLGIIRVPGFSFVGEACGTRRVAVAASGHGSSFVAAKVGESEISHKGDAHERGSDLLRALMEWRRSDLSECFEMAGNSH
jgi:hypothetical protein